MGTNPKFLLCENPIADQSDCRLFILHTHTPIILAEVFHFDIADESGQMDCKCAFATGSSLEYDDEYIVIGVRWIQENDLQPDRLAGIMRRMADWYHAYLVWEDNQDMDIDDEKSL